MIAGEVTFFNETKGYGFIEADEVDEDIFFHMEDIGGPDLSEGQSVTVEIEDAPKGPRAIEVDRHNTSSTSGETQVYDDQEEQSDTKIYES